MIASPRHSGRERSGRVRPIESAKDCNDRLAFSLASCDASISCRCARYSDKARRTTSATISLLAFAISRMAEMSDLVTRNVRTIDFLSPACFFGVLLTMYTLDNG